MLLLLEQLDTEESNKANLVLLAHTPTHNKIDLFKLSLANCLAPFLPSRVLHVLTLTFHKSESDLVFL